LESSRKSIDFQALRYLQTSIGRRKAFPNAAAAGLGVLELKPEDQKASAEIATLTAAVFTDSKAISKR